MNVGITLLVIVGVVILAQLLIQGRERRKQHDALIRRLDEIVARIEG